ncbi:zf-HC2 domain-containing protein [Streptomyces endophytica]|uniref:Zf-HC2 domain-containing protein n=1 Tax=Streptomyces endophytica TaxID=2991496 RepID=A0ABY6PFZ7_9ACTN|nr:zf-HC2 domain-containing protein [Streptomyces endophytica]UZJ32681.1 zf-HC2 domain-containing protein [Streptomyces endophytica]
MHCAPLRTALSARLDGEELPPGLTPRLLDDHLAGCADCRRWEARARALSARVAQASAEAARAPEAGGDPATVEALLAGLRSRPVWPSGVECAYEEGKTGGTAAG